jgi:hypothetical protein
VNTLTTNVELEVWFDASVACNPTTIVLSLAVFDVIVTVLFPLASKSEGDTEILVKGRVPVSDEEDGANIILPEPEDTVITKLMLLETYKVCVVKPKILGKLFTVKTKLAVFVVTPSEADNTMVVTPIAALERYKDRAPAAVLELSKDILDVGTTEEFEEDTTVKTMFAREPTVVKVIGLLNASYEID